jgi:pSer/pThr/pTyr-binding forkhead associated (FHA) protein
MAELCRVSEQGEVLERWEIGIAPLVVGRDDLSDIRINDENLSRHHFTVVRSGESYVIQDLGSANGTWVNGKQVTIARLEPNAWICSGQTVFVFRLHSQAAQWVVMPARLMSQRGVQMPSPSEPAS